MTTGIFKRWLPVLPDGPIGPGGAGAILKCDSHVGSVYLEVFLGGLGDKSSTFPRDPGSARILDHVGWMVDI